MRRLICTFIVRIWQNQVFSWRGSYTVRVPFQKIALWCYFSRSRIWSSICDIMAHGTETSYWPITLTLFHFKTWIYLSRKNKLNDIRNYRKQRLYVYRRVTCLSRFSLIMLLWWHNCITDCATFQSLSTIAPHITEQAFFLQRYPWFKNEVNWMNELWLYNSVVTLNCILGSNFSIS